MHIVGGTFRQRRLASPKGEQTRPTGSRLRESLFNICQGYIEGSRFLDLFAGSGAMGLEAISRGADSAAFVEKHKEALRCLQANIKTLGVENQTQVFAGDVFLMLDFLERKHLQFDIIFADPPYHTLKKGELSSESTSEKVIRHIAQGTLLAPEGTLFVEEAFQFEPKLPDFPTLVLKNSRRVGDTILQQWHRDAKR